MMVSSEFLLDGCAEEQRCTLTWVDAHHGGGEDGFEGVCQDAVGIADVFVATLFPI